MRTERHGPFGRFEARLALVCEDAPERQAVIKAALEQIGFTMLPVHNADEAIERLRRDVYEVVIVDEQYQGAAPLDNAGPGASPPCRCHSGAGMFVVLLGREFKTFDNMMAFARSVNVVVNLNDLPHLPAILRKGLEDNNEFYRVFRECSPGRQALAAARRPPTPCAARSSVPPAARSSGARLEVGPPLRARTSGSAPPSLSLSPTACRLSWEAVAVGRAALAARLPHHDAAIGLTWRLKDDLPAARRVYYARCCAAGRAWSRSMRPGVRRARRGRQRAGTTQWSTRPAV